MISWMLHIHVNTNNFGSYIDVTAEISIGRVSSKASGGKYVIFFMHGQMLGENTKYVFNLFFIISSLH